MRTYKTPDGEFPSVTTILEVIAKHGLNSWYAKLGEVEAKRQLEAAGERGTKVHDYIRAAYTQPGISASIAGIDDAHLGYLSSFQKFSYLYPIRPKHLEEMVWSRIGFAGTLDFLGVSQDAEEFYVIDWKTSSRIYMQHLLQVCAYAAAATEQGLVPVKGIKVHPIVVRLKEDGGEPEVKEVLEWKNLFQKGFVAALNLWQVSRTGKELYKKVNPFTTSTEGSSPKQTKKAASSASSAKGLGRGLKSLKMEPAEPILPK